MNCEKFQHAIDAAAERREQLDLTDYGEHLASCGNCRAVWNRYQTLAAAIHTARAQQVQVDWTDQLLPSILESQPAEAAVDPTVLPVRAPQLAERTSPLPSLVAVAALAVVIAVAIRAQLPGRFGSDAVQERGIVAQAEIGEQDAEPDLPTIIEHAQSAYSVLAADAVACVTDVVPIRPSEPGAQPDSSGRGPTDDPHPQTAPIRDQDAPPPLTPTWTFLKQLVPTTL